MRYNDCEEDIGGFWARFTGTYDELREPTDGEGNPLYAITPFMLLGHLLHALPPTWDEVARPLRELQPGAVNLDDIYRRLRAYEMNFKARSELGTANRVGGARNRDSSGNNPGTQAGAAAPGGGQPKPLSSPCCYCKKGPHATARCYQRLRDEHIAQHPGAPPPPFAWIRMVVNAGFSSPVDWAAAIQKVGAPFPGQPLDTLGPEYRTYLAHPGNTPASPPQT